MSLRTLLGRASGEPGRLSGGDGSVVDDERLEVLVSATPGDDAAITRSDETSRH